MNNSIDSNKESHVSNSKHSRGSHSTHSSSNQDQIEDEVQSLYLSNLTDQTEVESSS